MKSSVGAELQATGRLRGAWNGKSGEQAGAGSPECGEEEQPSSRPEAKAAAIVLMSSRKWWEFVKGGP